MTEIAMNNYASTWENMISSDTGRTKIGGNKLRTYRMVKTEFETLLIKKELYIPFCIFT